MQTRTQKDRHWVQIEMKPEGQRTGAIHVDLNMVDKVSFTREPHPTEDDFVVDSVEIIYAGTMKPIGLKGNKANWFYETWLAFLGEEGLHAKMDKATPGLIHSASIGVIRN